MVTDQQVRLLRQKRMDGKSQEAAAAAAGMSVRTARKWETGALPSSAKRARAWRTRNDPFEGVWTEEIVPLLRRDAEGIPSVDTPNRPPLAGYETSINGRFWVSTEAPSASAIDSVIVLTVTTYSC